MDDLGTIKDLVEETLEAMVAHGDIFEHHDIEGESRYGAASLLYAAPAGFVARESGTVILLGVASDQPSAAPDDLKARVKYENHLRRLTPSPGEDLCSELLQLGLIEISYREWLNSPPRETCAPARGTSRPTAGCGAAFARYPRAVAVGSNAGRSLLPRAVG